MGAAAMPHLRVITLILLLVAAGCSRSASYYLDRGNKLFEEGKPADAVIQYRKALQKDSKSGEAYYRLGLAELRQGNAIEAFRALSQAIQYTPANEDALAKLADLNLAAYLSDPRRSRHFYDQVEKLSAQLQEKNPKSVQGLRLKGALALVDRNPKGAITYYESANQIDPSQPDVVEGLVQALFQNNQFAEGEGVARVFLDKHKNAAPIYDVLYLRYLATNDLEKAESILLSKVSNNPSDAAYRLQLALFYARANRPPQMSAALQYILDHRKEFPQGLLQVGDFYNSIGNREEALRQFDEGARTNPKERVLYQKRIANTLLSQGKSAEAAKVVDQILKDDPKDQEAQIARADLLVGSGNSEQIRQAVVEYRALVKEKPEDAVLRFKLGAALLRNGNAQDASAEFEESARRSRSYAPPRLALAEISMSRQRPQQALRMTEEALALEPNQPRARLLHAAALSASGRQSEAVSELTQLGREYPQSPEVPMQLGILAIRQKKFADAEQIFRKMQQTSQGDALGAAGLAEAYTAQKEFAKAIPVLQDELKKSPGSAVIGNLLAFTALRAGNYDVAIETYRKMVEHAPQEAGVYWSLGQAYFVKGDYTHAVVTLEQAKKLAPMDGRIEMLLASALQRTGRGDTKAQFEHVLQLEPDNPAALNNMAFFLAENSGDLDEALKFAQRAVQRSKDELAFSDTLGWIYTKKNMYDAALQIFNKLVEKQPNNPTFRYHLGAALLGKGDREQARITLQTALDQKPAPEEDRKIKELLATIAY